VSLRSRGQVQKIRPHALVCPILGHTQPAALGARACRDRRRLAKRFWRGGAAQGRGPSKLGRRRRYARLVAEIVGSHRSLVYFRSFLVEMPGSAPTLIRENATLRTQAVGTRHSLGRFGCGRVPERAQGSTQLLHPSPDFQRFVDYGVTHTSLDRRRMPQSPL